MLWNSPPPWCESAWRCVCRFPLLQILRARKLQRVTDDLTDMVAAEALKPDVVDDNVETESDETAAIEEPSKLIRIASMTRAMLDEVRQSELDERGRLRLSAIYHGTLDQLKSSLGADLTEELETIFTPLETGAVSESELRIVQAQLVGWLEGLFHGIQASLVSQQAAAAAQLEEMRRRRALEASEARQPGSGQYL